MTLDELIERLQEFRDDIGFDVPVRGVQQPHYPLLAQLSAVSAIYKNDKVEVFIGLAEPKAYGTQDHYADDLISLDDVCMNCGDATGDCSCGWCEVDA
jgi:hypothetical protein